MRGFYWTANSPYIQGMWLRLRRAPRAAALSTTIADGFIPLVVGDRTFQDANPSFLIYECLTNTDWGMGGAPDAIDIAAFNAAAQLFRDEDFGLSMLWSKQDTIENFIGDVLDHVQCVLFLDPKTGLLVLKPLRDDYDVEDLPVFNPDNCDIEDFDRKVWGETINEIVVTWTNPVNEQSETVIAQDLANIVQQGGQVVSNPRNYYGARSASLASRLAHRDLRTACAPLSTCTLKATRQAFDLVPGACLRLTWPEENVEDLVMRVQTIDYGNKSDGQIKATLLEDIFALDSVAYTASPPTQWAPTNLPPEAISDISLLTTPAFVIAASADQFVDQPADPEVNVMILASDTNTDFRSYEPYTSVTLANGSPIIRSIGTGLPTMLLTTTAALVAEASTSLGIISGARLANLVFIEGGEIALVQAIGSDGSVTLARGVLDTVPQAWPIGTRLWFVGNYFLDTTARAPSESVTYRLLMRTSQGIFAYADATDRTITLTDRPYKPLRPANVKVNGVGFGTAALAGGDATITWSNRNRLLETSQILGWTAGTVVVESGQTTTVEVLNGSTVTHTYTGLTGTTYTVVAADLVGGNRIRVSSSRGGTASLQSFAVSYTA